MARAGRCTTGSFSKMRKGTPQPTGPSLTLHSSTFLAFCTGTGTFCPLCFDCDHTQSECALAPYSPTQQQMGAAGQTMQPYTTQPFRAGLGNPGLGMELPPLCISWKKGRCAKAPAACNYRHLSATCGRREHPACDCWLTPPDSFFKRGPARANEVPRLADPRKWAVQGSQGPSS